MLRFDVGAQAQILQPASWQRKIGEAPSSSAKGNVTSAGKTVYRQTKAHSEFHSKSLAGQRLPSQVPPRAGVVNALDPVADRFADTTGEGVTKPTNFGCCGA